MRPLIHPAIEEVQIEAILHALSDPVPAAIFADIVKGCQENCSTFLTVGDREIPKSTLSQHFTILSEAGLIRSERKGVEMLDRGTLPRAPPRNRQRAYHSIEARSSSKETRRETIVCGVSQERVRTGSRQLMRAPHLSWRASSERIWRRFILWHRQ